MIQRHARGGYPFLILQKNPFYKDTIAIRNFVLFSPSNRFMHNAKNKIFLRSRHSKLTPGPQARALVVEDEHADDAHDAEPRQQGDALVDAEVDEERAGEEDAAAGHGGAEEVVAGEEGGRVLRVRQGHVDENALQDHEAGAAVDDDADDARDPRQVRARRPREDEEPDRRQEGPDQRGHESVFLRPQPPRHDVGDEVEI